MLEFKSKADGQNARTALNGMKLNGVTTREKAEGMGGAPVYTPSASRIRARSVFPKTLIVYAIRQNAHPLWKPMTHKLTECGFCLDHGECEEGVYYVYSGTRGIREARISIENVSRQTKQNVKIECLEGWPDLTFGKDADGNSRVSKISERERKAS